MNGFDPDDPEVAAPAARVEDLPLFQGARRDKARGREISIEAGRHSLAQAAERHAEAIDRLLPLAKVLADHAGEQGITIADLRDAAVECELLTGEEVGRQLSYLGAVMRDAGLEQTGEYRRSHVKRSHGNLHAVWRSRASS